VFMLRVRQTERRSKFAFRVWKELKWVSWARHVSSRKKNKK
jgi:hypothetical protein